MMKRLYLIIICMLLLTGASHADNRETIYQGPKEIGDWNTVDLSSIKFHHLNLGDTIYVYAHGITPNSTGAFQDHEWQALATDVMNGGVITGDFEMVVNTQETLDKIKKHGLKIRGNDYVLDRVVIKHADDTVQTVIRIAAAIIILVILVAFAILIYKNYQLRKAYRYIYRANLDAIAAGDKERRMRTRYEGQLQAFREIMQASNKKYQNSTLDDDEKELLTKRILKLLEETDEIYASDFNLNKLADLTGSNYKNVSQTINEQFGKNFNQLLNEYRIKEACRRLSDIEHFGHHTIEAIGQDVGFGSRSTFVTTFKKITGLTPSEFQHQARV